MRSGKVGIVIVNWNGKRYLLECLSAVMGQTYREYDVFFVDNGSIDGSSAFVRDNFPGIKLIQLDRNHGFARGTNEGIREAFKDKEVEYIVCLNNDTIVDSRWLEELIKTARKDERTGSVGSLSLFPEGKVQTAGLMFVKDLQGDKDGGLSIGYGEDPDDYREEMEIFCPSGVSALYTRAALEDVGLFDSDFFAYVEDLDLGWRLRNRGYKSFCNPGSKLVHFHSRTGGAGSPLKSYYIKRNSYLTAVKNFDLVSLILFPFRDIRWDIVNFFKRDKLASVEKLMKKQGAIGMVFILIKAFFGMVVLLPKMLVKRYMRKKE